MPSFYAHHILPRILEFAMKDKAFQPLRAPTLAKASGKILEIGFGSGMNMLEYPNTVREMIAIDPSRELYAMANDRIRQSGIRVQFMAGSAEQLPFNDDEFDTTVSTWSLCSIPNVEKALGEIFRTLKPGGKFLFIEHGLSPASSWQQLQRLLTPIWKRIGGGCHLDRQIQKLVEGQGFILKCVDFPFEGRGKRLLHLYQGQAIKPRA